MGFDDAPLVASGVRQTDELSVYATGTGEVSPFCFALTGEKATMTR